MYIIEWLAQIIKVIFYPAINKESVVGRAMNIWKNVGSVNEKIGETPLQISWTYENLTELPLAAEIYLLVIILWKNIIIMVLGLDLSFTGCVYFQSLSTECVHQSSTKGNHFHWLLYHAAWGRRHHYCWYILTITLHIKENPSP